MDRITIESIEISMDSTQEFDFFQMTNISRKINAEGLSDCSHSCLFGIKAKFESNENTCCLKKLSQTH